MRSIRLFTLAVMTTATISTQVFAQQLSVDTNGAFTSSSSRLQLISEEIFLNGSSELQSTLQGQGCFPSNHQIPLAQTGDIRNYAFQGNHIGFINAGETVRMTIKMCEDEVYDLYKINWALQTPKMTQFDSLLSVKIVDPDQNEEDFASRLEPGRHVHGTHHAHRGGVYTLSITNKSKRALKVDYLYLFLEVYKPVQ